MKALIIAEDLNISNQISSYFDELGYDTIKYRYLLKALDNVEEINPQVIFISVQDYPRHWKTFLQYTSAINLNCKIILYSEAKLSSDEIKKAEFLNVEALMDGLDYDNKVLLREVLGIHKEKTENKSAKIENVEPKIENSVEKSEKVAENCEIEKKNEKKLDFTVEQNQNLDNNQIKFVFTNPENGNFVNGKVVSYENPILVFEPYFSDEISDLRFGQVIQNCTLKCGKKLESVHAQIRSLEGNIEFCIIR